MQLNPAEISELIKSRIEGLAASSDIRNQGTVVSVSDGIVRIHGLSDVMQGEMLEFPATADGTPSYGLALNLERDSVGAGGEFKHFALHHVRQAVDAANTVRDGHNRALIADVCHRGQALNTALDQFRNFCGIELHDSFLLSLNGLTVCGKASSR